MAVNVVLKSVFDDKGIRDAQGEFAKVGKSVGTAFAAIGAAAAVAGVAIGKFAAASINSASNLQESLNAVKVSYGDASESIAKLGEDAATRLGLTQTDFNQAAVRFSAFADRIVGDGGNVTKFIDDITTRAADFASVFNIEVSEALQVFQSGLAGEAEPLKRFGINLLESEVKAYALRNGIGAVGKELTETEKVQARYGLLLESTNKTAGDFANTSDGLANAQRRLKAGFEDVQAQVGQALLPVVEDLMAEFIDLLPVLRDALIPASEELAKAVKTSVVPAIKDFTGWLASPKGTQAVKDLVNAIVTGISEFFKFAQKVIENWDAIVKYTTAIASATVIIRGLMTAVNLVRGAQLLWNVAVTANPLGLLIVALGLATAAVITFSKELTEEERAIRKTNAEVGKLEQQQIQLTEKIKQGGIEVNAYKKKLQEVNSKLVLAKSGMSDSAGEANRFTTALKNAKTAADAMNGASLSKYRGQLGDTRVDAERLVNAQRELAYYMNGGKPGGYKPLNTTTTTTTTGGSTGMTAAEQKKAFDKIAKDTQESLRKARAAYNGAVAKARAEYTKAVVSAEDAFNDSIFNAELKRQEGLEKAASDNAKRVADIQRQFSQRLADIIQQSQDRLRDVYRTAVTTNIADLFGTEQVNKSVDALVGELRKKLEASRTLLENASKLAASGFSQTFIEQVVAAGTTSGNELAQSILEATPETQAELKSLYGALETQSERGMDNLARTIYEGAGLATSELRKLYDQTVVDQTTALSEQAALYAETQAQILTEFDNAITEANAKRDEALAAAHASLSEALTAATKEYRDSLDEIQKDFEDRIDALGKLQDDLLKRQAIVAGQIGGAQANIPSIASQIGAVEKATVVTIPPTSAITGGNTVNVNVKVDPGTSAAQAGKKIANVVQKYTTAGGGGSAMPWQVL